jgi:hypothetical protein
MPTDYTVRVSDYEQEVLEWVVKTINTERGTTLTVAQFLQTQVPLLVSPSALKYEEAMADAVRKRYALLDSATKAQVRELSGVE